MADLIDDVRREASQHLALRVKAEIERLQADRERLRDDRWKHGAECMRHAILQQLQGDSRVADMVRAIAVPSADQ